MDTVIWWLDYRILNNNEERVLIEENIIILNLTLTPPLWNPNMTTTWSPLLIFGLCCDLKLVNVIPVVQLLPRIYELKQSSTDNGYNEKAVCLSVTSRTRSEAAQFADNVISVLEATDLKPMINSLKTRFDSPHLEIKLKVNGKIRLFYRSN